MSGSALRAPWFGPAPSESGLPIAAELHIAENKKLSLLVDRVTRFEHGISFHLVLHRPLPQKPDPYDLKSWTHGFNRHMPRAGRLPAEFAPEVLRISIDYGDGRRARNIDPGPWLLEPGEEPDAPVLVSLSGTSDDHLWEQEYWLWPLPETPTVDLTLEWWSAGVSRRTVELPIR